MTNNDDLGAQDRDYWVRRTARNTFAMQCMVARTDDEGMRDYLIAAGVGEVPNHDLLDTDTDVLMAALLHKHEVHEGSCSHCGMPEAMIR